LLQQVKMPVPVGLVLATVVIGAPVLSGCASQDSAYGSQKVTVCHRGDKTLVIPAKVLAAHMAHGDTQGACE